MADRVTMNNADIFVAYVRTDISDQQLLAGGSVAHTKGVVQGLLQQGCRVICVSSVMVPLLETMGCDVVIQLHNPWWLRILRWKLNCLFSNIVFTYQLLKVVTQKKVTVIYQRYSLLNATGIIVQWLTGIPCVIEYNGSEVWLNKVWGKKNRFTLSWLSRCIEYYVITRAFQLVVVSDVLRNELLQRGVQDTKIVVSSNGVDSEYYNPAVIAQAAVCIRQQYGCTTQFVFGFIGTFSVWHGIEVVAYMIPKIIAKYPKTHFLLIGDGPLRASLQESLRERGVSSDKVTFTGMVPQNIARDYLSACDAFLCPTQPNADGTPFFGSPTKLFEYLSMARPIIASDIESVRDIVFPALKVASGLQRKDAVLITDEVGIVVPPYDSEGFVKAAELLLKMSEQQRQLLGSNGRKRALAQYQWKDHVQKILESMH